MKGQTDGLIAARRCLEAMSGRDLETRKSLWAAAKRYAAKDRISAVGGPGGIYADRLAMTAGVGSFGQAKL